MLSNRPLVSSNSDSSNSRVARFDCSPSLNKGTHDYLDGIFTDLTRVKGNRIDKIDVLHVIWIDTTKKKCKMKCFARYNKEKKK